MGTDENTHSRREESTDGIGFTIPSRVWRTVAAVGGLGTLLVSATLLYADMRGTIGDHERRMTAIESEIREMRADLRKGLRVLDRIADKVGVAAGRHE